MIDYTTFPLGVRVRRDLEKNYFVVGNPFEGKRLHVRLRPNGTWKDVFIEPMMEVVFPLIELATGKESNIEVSVVE